MAEKDFQYYKKWALGVLKKQYDALDKKEKENKKVSKAFTLAEKEMEKAFPVGTIRTWKGKKFIKSPDKKWRPYYEKHNSAGAKKAIANIARQINSLEDGDFEGLYNILKLHKSRFAGQENQIMEIYKLAKEKGAKVGGRFSNAKKEEEKQKNEAREEDIADYAEGYHEYDKKDSADNKWLEAKVLNALYGDEWDKEEHGDWDENGLAEKWNKRVDEAADFAENYQNMANSDNAVDAMGVLCAGDAYLGQGDMFGGNNSFSDEEKKNIKAYEALSGEKLPSTKDEVAKYFKDKRKTKPESEKKEAEKKEEESKKETKASLPKIEGISEKEIKEAYEGLSEEDKEFLTSEIEDRCISNSNKFRESEKENFDEYSRHAPDSYDWEKDHLKWRYESKKDAYERNKTDAEAIKHAWESPLIIEKLDEGLYSVRGETGQTLTDKDGKERKRLYPWGVYKTKEEVDKFERLKSRIAPIACKLNDTLISLLKDEADFLKELYTKKKKDPSFDASKAASYKDFEKWQKEKGEKKEVKPEPKEESKKETKTSLPKIEGISEKEIKEAYEGLSEEDKEFLTSRLDRNVNIARFKEAAKESLDNTFLDAKELKREYERKKAAYERNKHDAEIIKRAWETPTIVEESSLGYDLKGDTGEYINGTDYQGNRMFPFGLYRTKKEVDQFERVKSRLASLACKINDIVVSLCKDEADFFKEMYTKKKKDPSFNARDAISYEKFEKWQKEKGGKEEKKSKKVKKSFCYFDKTGRLWMKKAALNAFMG